MDSMRRRESEAFTRLVDKVLSVPHSEIIKREAEYRKQAAQNPRKRGPKRKPLSKQENDTNG